MKPRLYLDVCAIQRPYDDQSQARIRVETEAVLSLIEAVENGGVSLIASSAHRFENQNNPFPERRAHTNSVLQHAAEHVHMSEPVNRLVSLFVRGGVKPLDALHLAYAATAGADYFCSTDDRLLKRAQHLNLGPMRAASPAATLLDLEAL